MCLGVPGQIVEIVDEEARLGIADFGGVRRRVNLSCVLSDGERTQDLIGAWVLVHVGFAMSLIAERQALETLELLAELEEFQEELGAMATSDGA